MWLAYKAERLPPPLSDPASSVPLRSPAPAQRPSPRDPMNFFIDFLTNAANIMQLYGYTVRLKNAG
jgi:hypothetical protein